MDMDKNDIIAFFQELRLKSLNNKNIGFIDKIFEEYEISKLDIKRFYRYLDKNIKKDIILEEDSDHIDDE
jgi:hypothetical protein